MNTARKLPPPLPQRPRVEVWEYLEDGLWSSLGEAFPPIGHDPFFVMLSRILPWWPEGHDDIGSILEMPVWPKAKAIFEPNQ